MAGANHFDKGKVELAQVPYELKAAVARVLMMGAKKYGRDNWREGMDWSKVINSTMRHIEAYNDPNQPDVDPESGESHLSHAACNIAFLLYYEKHYPELDDRAKPVADSSDSGWITDPTAPATSFEEAYPFRCESCNLLIHRSNSLCPSCKGGLKSCDSA